MSEHDGETKPLLSSSSSASAPKSHLTVLNVMALGMCLIVTIAVSLAHHDAVILIGAGWVVGAVLFIFDIGFCRAFGELLEFRTYRFRQIILAIALTSSMAVLPLVLAPEDYKGHVHPLSFSVIIGAFIFGAGMYVCSACASGVLVDVGVAATNAIGALAMFIVGSVLGAWQFGFWFDLGSLPPVNLLDLLGWKVALGLQLGFLTVIYFGLMHLEQWKLGDIEGTSWISISPSQLKYHLHPYHTGSTPPPLWIGALALSVAAITVWLLKGTPWGISSGLTTLGCWPLYEIDGTVEAWQYFKYDEARIYPVAYGIFEDGTLLTDIGLIMGVIFFAIYAQRFYSTPLLDLFTLPRFLLGGLMLGYGARLAFGCNIGAFFSGAASFSLHAWLWLLSAIPGYALVAFSVAKISSLRQETVVESEYV